MHIWLHRRTIRSKWRLLVFYKNCRRVQIVFFFLYSFRLTPSFVFEIPNKNAFSNLRNRERERKFREVQVGVQKPINLRNKFFRSPTSEKEERIKCASLFKCWKGSGQVLWPLLLSYFSFSFFAFFTLYSLCFFHSFLFYFTFFSRLKHSSSKGSSDI